MKSYDAIVIGAGPAGTATAIFLKQKGHRVLLLDQARFPRDKVCGEFISPAADPVLKDLGVWSSILDSNPVRLSGVYLSAYNKRELGIPYPSVPGSWENVSSLSLPRKCLDTILARQVTDLGIDFFQGYKVDDLVFSNGNVTGVKGWDDNKTKFETHAKVVIDAGGRNSISLRRLNLIKKTRKSQKIAMAAHWSHVHLPKNLCYMHISHPGYTGISQVGEGLANIVLVVDSKDIDKQSVPDYYQSTVLGNSLRAELLKTGSMMESPRTIASLGFEVKPVPCGGLVLVGDAMGFIDPFTGEGIYLALRSAQLASQTVDESIKTGKLDKTGLDSYFLKRENEFRKKFQLSKILQVLIYNPVLCDHVLRVLTKNPYLAKTLVGVIGDYIPADRVISFKFLYSFLKSFLFKQHKEACLPPTSFKTISSGRDAL